MDADRIRQWRAEGLTDAEIGHRLGVSADRLRELLDEPAVSDPNDDHRPNDASVR